MHRAKLKSDKCFKPFQINFIQHSRSLIKQNLILFFVGIDSVEKTFSGPASLSTQNKHLFWNPVAPKKFKTPLILTFWRVHISSSKNRVCFWNGQSWETCDNYTIVENAYPFNRILKWQIMGPSKMHGRSLWGWNVKFQQGKFAKFVGLYMSHIWVIWNCI